MQQAQLPPAIACVVEAYKVRLFHDPHCPLDSFLEEAGPSNGQAASSDTTQRIRSDTTQRIGDRSLLFRRLLEEERAAADSNCVPFDRYWSRPWFDAHIHDVVAVLLADRFEVQRPIGSGGQGLVYLVKNLKVGRLEALKIFHLKNHRDLSEAEVAEWRERFSRESGATESLHRTDSGVRSRRDRTTRRNNEETARHHNVPIVYEVNQLNGIHYFTMQYIDGVTLRELLERTKGPIAPRQAAQWMLTVARTLALLHATGHIHRDVKPGNLMVDNSGTLYLVDFGLVKVISEGLPDLTQAGGIGTPNYMAREQLVDARKVSPKADVFSLGATFYHVLTGQVWQGKAIWPKQVPRLLRDLCTASLAEDPDKRPTASEIERKLHRWLNGISRRQILAVAAVAFAGAVGATWQWAVPKSLAALRDEAETLRGEYVSHLLAQRRHFLKDGTGLFLYGMNNDESKEEVTAAAQSCYAILTLPLNGRPTPLAGFDNFGATDLARNLSQPFDPGTTETFWRMRRDASNRELGWVYSLRSNESPKPTADCVLWMTIAHARAIRCCGEHRDMLPDIARHRIRLQYDKLVDILKAYATPGRPGAWNRYANQVRPEMSNSATSAVALLALLEAHAAGLPWFEAGDVGPRPALWIPKTIAYLGERFKEGIPSAPGHHDHAANGWYCNHSRLGECGDSELGLMVHAILLQAVKRFGMIDADVELVKRHLLSLLFLDRFNRARFPIRTTVQVEVELDRNRSSLTDVEREGNEKIIAKEPLMLAWYPWAIAAATQAIEHADRLNLSAVDRNRILLSVGAWTGAVGAEMKELIFRERTSCVAESLMGLAFVTEEPRIGVLPPENPKMPPAAPPK
jgi:hypothetical protein